MTRKEAKEKLYMEWQKFLEDNIDYAGISEAYNMAFKALEQEPKTGHWIFDDECKEHGHCSECGCGIVDLMDGKPHRFCQSCGVKMVKPEGLI